MIGVLVVLSFAFSVRRVSLTSFCIRPVSIPFFPFSLQMVCFAFFSPHADLAFSFALFQEPEETGQRGKRTAKTLFENGWFVWP